MENCIHSELLGAANNNNLEYLGYLKIHVDSDNRSAGDNLLAIQVTEQNSKLFIANTDAVLSNGTKEYNFGTFVTTFTETPSGLFPVNVGEYDVYVPKYSLRGLLTNFRNVIVDFDLKKLQFSSGLHNLRSEGTSSAKGNISALNVLPLVTIGLNVSSVTGDINSIKDAIVGGFTYLIGASLTKTVSLQVGVSPVGGVLKTFLDTIAVESIIDSECKMNINLFRSSVDVTGTNATTSVAGEHKITFNGQGGYTITPPSA